MPRWYAARRCIGHREVAIQQVAALVHQNDLGTVVPLIRLEKRTRGQFRAVPFKAGTSESDRGRYALTEIVGSLAPNTIVIGVDVDSDLLLVHQLRRGQQQPVPGLARTHSARHVRQRL